MKLLLSIHASKLGNTSDAFKGKSNPFAILSLIYENKNVKPIILGKTEV